MARAYQRVLAFAAWSAFGILERMTKVRGVVLSSVSLVSGLCLVAACTGDDPAATPVVVDPDSGVDGSSAESGGGEAGGDAGTDGGPACNPEAPFGAPELVPDVNNPTWHSAHGRITPAGLYLSSDRHAGNNGPTDLSKTDLYFAPTTATGFGPFDRLIEASTPGSDASPTESADRKTLYFDAPADPDAGAATNRRIRRTTRQNVGDRYTGSTSFAPIAGSLSDQNPYLVGTTLYFASQLPGDGGLDYTNLYRVAVNDTGLAGTPERVPGIETAADLVAPVVAPDEKSIYFLKRGGTIRIQVATRTTTSIPFGAATDVTNLQVKEIVTPTGMSPDGCELYLHARASDERFSLYRARRPR